LVVPVPLSIALWIGIICVVVGDHVAGTPVKVKVVELLVPDIEGISNVTIFPTLDA
jgi:hypothetical protein